MKRKASDDLSRAHLQIGVHGEAVLKSVMPSDYRLPLMFESVAMESWFDGAFWYPRIQCLRSVLRLMCSSAHEQWLQWMQIQQITSYNELSIVLQLKQNYKYALIL